MSFSGFTRLDPRPGTHASERSNLSGLWHAFLAQLPPNSPCLQSAQALDAAQVTLTQTLI